MNRGFTIIEMLVALFIIGVLAAIILTSRSQFSSTVLLTNTASDVALSLRSAETYGIGTKTPNSANQNAGYGISFDDPYSYTFFEDTDPSAPPGSSPLTIPGDGQFKAGADQLVQTYQLGNSMRISAICGYEHVEGNKCYTPGDDHLDIVFVRPNTLAIMHFILNNGKVEYPPDTKVGLETACIVIQSPQNTTATIRVDQLGEISISSTCP